MATNAVNSPVFALSRAQLTQATTCLSHLPGPARPSGPSRPATWPPALRSTLPQAVGSPTYLADLSSDLSSDLFSDLFSDLSSDLSSDLRTALPTALPTALSSATCAAKFHPSGTICVQPCTALSTLLAMPPAAYSWMDWTTEDSRLLFIVAALDTGFAGGGEIQTWDRRPHDVTD